VGGLHGLRATSSISHLQSHGIYNIQTSTRITMPPSSAAGPFRFREKWD